MNISRKKFEILSYNWAQDTLVVYILYIQVRYVVMLKESSGTFTQELFEALLKFLLTFVIFTDKKNNQVGTKFHN